MDQRLNILTLGVDDVPRATDVLRSASGWTVTLHRRRHRHVPGRSHDRVVVGSRPSSPTTAASPRRAREWGGFTLGYAVDDAAEVDAICDRRSRRGGDAQRAPARQGLRLLGGLRRSRRPHVGGRLDRARCDGTTTARWSSRHERGDELRATCLAMPGCDRDVLVRARGLGVQGGEREDVRGEHEPATEPLDVSVKCDPDAGIGSAARATPPIVEGYHLNKRHWITVTIGADVPDDDGGRVDRGQLRPRETAATRQPMRSLNSPPPPRAVFPAKSSSHWWKASPPARSASPRGMAGNS